MTASGASVAVFSEEAKDMFPDPDTAIDEDDVPETGETDAEGEPIKVNRLGLVTAQLMFCNITYILLIIYYS